MYWDDWQIKSGSQIDFVVSAPGSYKPIPLTEEWLVRLGFELQTDDEDEPDNLDKTFYTNGSEMQIETDGGIKILFSGMDFPEFTNHIKHVHQLQNLYFALTGRELIIKNE